MWQRFSNALKKLVDDRILRHFRESHHPLHELGLASAVGLFWALTPLVGIQMLLVTLNWLLFRPFRLHFHLVIGVAWVWLSNPFTMAPLYYGFYVVGYYFFIAIGQALEPVSFGAIQQVLSEASALGMTGGLLHWMEFMIYRLGWPMLVGGFVMGLPGAIAGYPLTVYFVRRFRERKAAQMGIPYAEWERRFVLHRGEIARFGQHAEPEARGDESGPTGRAVARNAVLNGESADRKTTAVSDPGTLTTRANAGDTE